MGTTQNIETPHRAIRKRKVPDYLVRETIDGRNFYYSGYRQVLAKKKKLEDIMGRSGLQGLIGSYFTYLALNQLNHKKYLVFPGVIGNQLDYCNNLSLDISIFDRQVLTPEKITPKYIAVSANCVIQIDLQVESDNGDLSAVEFIGLKTNKLFEFGTQKLIWVLSKSKKVIVAEPGKRWEIIDWSEDIDLIEGITFNVGQHLQAEGINPDAVPPKT